jgi:uncharacterized RDD family membrane protein YckC
MATHTAIVLLALALVYVPAVTRRSRSLASPYQKADVRRRFIAAAIDGSLCLTCFYFYRSSGSAVFLFFGAAYLALRDALFRGQSVGKFLTGLVVIRLETARPCSAWGSIERNLFLLVPGLNVAAAVFEAMTIARDPKGQRLGDRLARTQVVEALGAKELVKLVRKQLLEAAAEARVMRDPADQPVPVDS